MFYSLQYMEEPTVTFDLFFRLHSKLMLTTKFYNLSVQISMLPCFEADIF